jgi:outer membrane protein assembly factor BamB
MVHETPAWRYQTEHSLTLGYGHVHLLPNHVLGQWFCVERESGQVLWDSPVAEADSVVGVSEGVIIATESRMSGPGTYTYGVFAISLETGKLLWTSHFARRSGRGLLEAAANWFGIDTVDYASGVRGSECITAAGRVLDLHSGKELRREPASAGESWPAFWKLKPPGWHLYGRHPVECGSGRILRHGLPGAPKKEGVGPDGTFNCFLSDAQGQPLWSFDLAGTGHHIRGNFFSYRLSDGFVYMVVSDRPQSVPIDPAKPMIVKDNPAHYSLWVLEVDSGNICQKFRLTGEETTNCRLEDIDDRALLLSCGKSALLFNRLPKLRQ